ncbi:DUF2179 domain-containing protein [Candidatus Woesearchaeota archaeon]|nr:DUF2179 domain-containing protein [Candidatus Woesearchaeota archaeon]
MVFDYYTFVILPALIFIARIADVSIGTLRIIFLSKGYRVISPILGFFEVFIWLLAARQVLVTLDSWVPMIAYAAGFATGTYVGIVIEQKVSLGKVVMRIITNRDAKVLMKAFEQEDFPITNSNAVSSQGKVRVIYIVLNRKQIGDALSIVRQHNPNASYSIEDVRFASERHPFVSRKGRFHLGMFRKVK